MDDIAFACEAVIDVANELIFDKAFDKSRKLTKRIPFMIIYVLLLSGIIFLLGFISINLIIRKNYFGLLFIIMSLLSLFMLIYPFIFYKKKKEK